MAEITDHYPLWIEGGWTRDRLMAFSVEIGLRAFDRGFRQRAYSEDDREFSEADILKCFHSQISIEDCVQPDWPRYIGVDLSSDKRSGNVIFVLANSPKNIRYPIEILYGAWKSPETAKVLHETYERHHPQIIKVENNGYQTAIIEWCAELGWHDMPIEGFMTGRQKADQEVGVPSLAVEMHNEAWFVAMGGKNHEFDCKCGACEWRKDLRAYPQGEGRKFDFLMASWFAREAVRSGKGKVKRDVKFEAW